MIEKQKGFPLLPQVTTVGDNILTGNNTFTGNNSFEGNVTYGSSSTVTVNGTLQNGNNEEYATIPYVDGVSESYTINSWTALSDSSPYTYQATATATYTIGNDTLVELINDQAVLFANYGFAIGAVSGQNVTFYSIGEPTSDVTLEVVYHG